MPSIADLMSRAERLAEREQLSLSTVSRKLLNDGKGLSRLKAGGQLTLKTMDRALTRLSALERGSDPDAPPMPVDLERKFMAPPVNGEYGRRPALRAMSHLDRLEAEASAEMEALVRSVNSTFEAYVRANGDTSGRASARASSYSSAARASSRESP